MAHDQLLLAYPRAQSVKWKMEVHSGFRTLPIKSILYTQTYSTTALNCSSLPLRASNTLDDKSD